MEPRTPIPNPPSMLSRLQTREMLIVAGPAVLVVLAAFWIAYQFVQPAPPARISLTTGSTSGAYYRFGNEYAKLLQRSGLELQVLPSGGSVENLRRLTEGHAGERVDLALLQGGITNAKSSPEVVSYGRIFIEPLWIFHRLPDDTDRLAQLHGKRLAVGGEGSGTRRLVESLLSANGVNAVNSTFLPLGSDAAAAALRDGEVDVAFLMLAPESPLVQGLLRDERLSLLSLRQAEAYTRRFPFLVQLVLPEGVIDLARNLPRSDVRILAAQAALVGRADVHPALAGPIVDALREVHSGGGLFQRVGDFPKAQDPELPMSEDAARIHANGQPFLQRFLPFWLASFIERMIIMAVPIATILLPLIKVVPMVYEWRIRSRLLYWYGQLKGLEQRLGDVEHADDLVALSHEIDHVDDAVRTIPVPLHYSDRHYELRAAIDLVRQKIAARSTRSTGSGAPLLRSVPVRAVRAPEA